MLVFLSQGIPLFEAIPWKTIAVPAIILGLVLGFAYEGSRFVQSRTMNQLLRTQVASIETLTYIAGQMHVTLTDILETTHSLDETALSTAQAKYLPKDRNYDKTAES